ncbi:GNAT family N-acetyltransferase [Candidatus Izemoplasma sp. B36]|uniref:GNAT family N-acetyltransferase n=1 Tax=Candidatus Izemoplasma sp. B36 TaxID=3242468 RepID=UPI0035576F4F
MSAFNIETKDVYIRKIKKSDFNDIKEYLQDEYVCRFFDHGVLTDERIKELIRDEDIKYGIIDKLTDKLIGHFIYNHWFMVDTFEVGWVLNKKYHNKKIVTNLAKEFLKFAFEKDKAHRIIATCQPENIASKKVCENIGLRLEGTFKKCIYVKRKDEWWDELFYAMLNKEYLGGNDGNN